MLWLRIKIIACGHGVSVYPDHGENHPQTSAKSEILGSKPRQETARGGQAGAGLKKRSAQIGIGPREKATGQGDKTLDRRRGLRGVQPLSQSQSRAEG